MGPFLRNASKLCRYYSVMGKTIREFPVTSGACIRGFLTYIHGRTYSSDPGSRDVNCVETEMVTDRHTMEFSVNPFGKLIGKLVHTRTDISVVALDPHKYPLQDRAYIEVESDGNPSASQSLTWSLEDDIIHLASQQCDEKYRICKVRVTVPLKFDIDISLNGGNGVAIQNFENYDINIKADNGICQLKNIKCGSVSVTSAGGDIRCEKLLQGNSKLVTTGHGSIFAERVQGLTFESHTEQGDIALHVLYADQASFSSGTGSLYIKGCQRQTEVHLGSGNLTIGSLEGDLHALLEDGDAELYAAKHGQVGITAEKGNIHLKLPESIETRVDIEGHSIDTAEEFVIDCQQESKNCIKGTINMCDEETSDPLVTSAQSQLTLKAPRGTVRLTCLDWLTALSLYKALEDVD